MNLCSDGIGNGTYRFLTRSVGSMGIEKFPVARTIIHWSVAGARLPYRLHGSMVVTYVALCVLQEEYYTCMYRSTMSTGRFPKIESKQVIPVFADIMDTIEWIIILSGYIDG